MTSRTATLPMPWLMAVAGGLLFCGTGLADTIGQPLERRQNYTESAGGFLFIYTTPIPVPAVGANVFRWGEYGQQSATITPLLFAHNTNAGVDQYQLVAIGQTATTANGVGHLEWFSFIPTAGSSLLLDQTGIDYHFGWKDGSATAGNTGTIYYTRQGDATGKNAPPYAGGQYLLSRQSNFTYSYNASYAASQFDVFNRDYSIQFDYDDYPEPSTFLLLGGGITALFFLRRLAKD